MQAASQRFELIPIALQRDCVEIVNTFLTQLDGTLMDMAACALQQLAKGVGHRIVELHGPLPAYGIALHHAADQPAGHLCVIAGCAGASKPSTQAKPWFMGMSAGAALRWRATA